jgi:hypothetical protein
MSGASTRNPDVKRAPEKGKQAEKDTQEWLEARSSSLFHFAYHRMPDAKAARGAIAAQPADFLVGQTFADGRKVAYLLEVKETAELRRLPKDKVGQYGKLYMFNSAGFEVRVLINRTEFKDWVYLTAAELFPSLDAPKSFPFEGLKSFPTHAAALQEIFQ